jgi:murein L,D-transpeptidase YafK
MFDMKNAIFSAALVLSAALSPSAMAQVETTRADKVPSSLLHLGVASGYYSPYAFVVDKKARELTVWTQDADGYRVVEKFQADLGKKDGDKRSSGDYRTPEGVYFLVEQLTGPGLDFSQYGKRAFTTNYPNFFDRRDGKTGTGIWLHAVPDTTPLTRGSRGCVVVRNEVIDKLQQYVRLEKTPILIEPNVELIDAAALRAEDQALTTTLENWRTAWEAKNIDSYISHYSSEFKSMNMDRDGWKRYKGNLNLKYQKISVRLSRPVLLRFRDRIIARFIQHYSSDHHADIGEKTVYLKKEAEGFKIVGEEWAEDKSQLASDELERAALSPARSTASNY